MADDKTKRLRTHVVKELYETEGDYTEHLEFTVTVSRGRIQQLPRSAVPCRQRGRLATEARV